MSAAGYTNRVRTKAEARVRKVQYQFNNATNYNPLAAACAANPDFTILNYGKQNTCPKPPVVIVYYYDGGDAFVTIFDGDDSYHFMTYYNILADVYISSNVLYDGGGATDTFLNLYYGGGASDNYPNILQDDVFLPTNIILDSNILVDVIHNPEFDGAYAATTISVILDGGNSIPL
jgi:hypothetical protein